MTKTIEELQKEWDEWNKQCIKKRQDANKSMEEGFILNLDWIDKVMTLSITIIGASITAYIALQDEISLAITNKCVFFLLWFIFALAALLCVLARYGFAHIRLIQTNLLVDRSNIDELCAKKVDTQQQSIILGIVTPLDVSATLTELDRVKTIVEKKIMKGEKNEEGWVLITNWSSDLAIGLFFIGIVIFLVIGFDLVN